MPATYKAVFVGQFYGQRTYTSFFYRLVTTAGGNQLVQLANAIETFAIGGGDTLDTRWEKALTPDWAWLETQITRLSTVVFNRTRFQAGATGNGVLIDTAAPPTTAAVVKRRTNFATRIGQGRIFVPSVPVGALLAGRIDSGLPGATYRTALTNLCTGMMSNITGTDGVLTSEFQPCLVRGGTSDVNGDPISDSMDICAFDLVLRVQRRREVGVGV